jgi:plastocyanin
MAKNDAQRKIPGDRRPLRVFPLLALLIAGAFAASCGGDDDDDSDDGYGDDDADDDAGDDDDDDAADDDDVDVDFEVSIDDMDVSPDPLSISVGDTVRWTNNDEMPHTVTSGTPESPDGEFDSGNMDSGDVFTHTFDAAGSFIYFCEYHTDTMFGYEIVVGE